MLSAEGLVTAPASGGPFDVPDKRHIYMSPYTLVR